MLGSGVSTVGSGGTRSDALSKSNAEVRSPQTARRHGVMFGSSTPNRASMKRISEVASNTSEQTHPPLVHGETTSNGTRTPRPYGPMTPFVPPGVPAVPPNSSLSSGTVDWPASAPTLGYGPTRWSKKPSFSSQLMNKAVFDHTSGLLVSALRTPAV